jgi:hypothetical protein
VVAKVAKTFGIAGGDEPNFLVVEEITDVGDPHIDDLDTLDDLVDWLESTKSANLR